MVSEAEKRVMELKKQEALRKQTSRTSALPWVKPTGLSSKPTTGITFESSLPPPKQPLQQTIVQDENSRKRSYEQTFANMVTKQSFSKVFATCCVISTTEFVINSKYCKQLIDLYKTFPTKEYDAISRVWKFPLSDYEMIFKKLSTECQDTVELTPLPHFLIKSLKKERAATTSVDWSRMPDSSALMPFQRTGIEFAVSLGGRVLIGDEMGLGKTVQALYLAHYYKNEWPLVIFCPSSLRYTWANAVGKWLPDVSLEFVSVLNSGKNLELTSPNCQIIICSYSIVSKLKKELTNKKLNVLILDESHYIKAPNAVRTKAVQEIARNAKRIIMLSGTPIMSRPIELFTQLQLLDRNLFSNRLTYAKRYCNAQERSWGWDMNGSSNLEEFKILMSLVGFIRRLKKDVLSQLPPKTRKIITLDKSSIKANNKELKTLSQRVSNVDSSKLLSAHKDLLFEYYAKSAIAKRPAVIEYLGDLLENDGKIILFAYHVDMLDGIAEFLTGKSVGFIRIDGKTLSSDRQPLVDYFQTTQECRVALLSIMAANTGLTLTAASLVVFAELSWNPGDLVQAEDRAYRIGQACNVVVHYLLAEKTADDVIWPMIQKKLDVMTKAGLSKDNFDDAESSHYKSKNQEQLNFASKSSSTNQPASAVNSSNLNADQSSTIVPNGSSETKSNPVQSSEDPMEVVDSLSDWDDADWGDGPDDEEFLQAALDTEAKFPLEN